MSHITNHLTILAAKALDIYDAENVDNIFSVLDEVIKAATNFGYIPMLDAIHTVWREQLAWGNGYVLDSYVELLDDLYSEYPCKEGARPLHWNAITTK